MNEAVYGRFKFIELDIIYVSFLNSFAAIV
jgi:hypothetical protein